MIKPRKRLLDVEALAMHYGVAPGSIRRWACEFGCTPYGTRRSRQWDMLEIQRGLDERAAREAERHARIDAACA